MARSQLLPRQRTRKFTPVPAGQQRNTAIYSMIDPFETDEDSDEWESDSEDVESPLYVDRDGKKMTEEEYYFKVLGKPMPKSSDEGTAVETEPPRKKTGKRVRDRTAPLKLPGTSKVRRRRANVSRIDRILDGTEARALKRLSIARFSCKQFEKRKVPKEIMNKVLSYTMRAPTAFNVQPYKIVIVTDDLLKVRLTGGLMGNNKDKILRAGATAIFLADLEPIELIPELERLMPKEWHRELEKSEIKVNLEMPRYIRFFGQEVNTPREWGAKNTMIAASWYMMAATAFGLATAPIEGFNEEIILDTLGIPKSRYHIPIMIPTGYSGYTGSFTKRLPPKDVCFLNGLDDPLIDIDPLTDSSLID
eukprot:CAMPEP_0167762976 /NCGR_PEP_ID=MMETSP0110_2-20121227/13086_1 /TAXON_ID=629695 /ORGANISM="Gymnochlora sp., Strain CCMP2014" /LENGTH=362 /DNA_ID=CAMNT_0007649949 /DNA_START=92 /DNA_END=1180 /DNA_ORIENTATION=+